MTSQRKWRGLLFAAPFLALYAVILIFPLLRGLWLSLYQVDLFGAGHFVGFGNYARLAHDPVFGTSLVNTFEVTLMIVPALTVISLLLALALNRAGGGAAFLRGIFFASAVLSVTIVTLVWQFMLAPDAGLLGETWKALGWEPLPFLSRRAPRASGIGDHHYLVVRRLSDAVVPRRPAAGPAGHVRSRGAR